MNPENIAMWKKNSQKCHIYSSTSQRSKIDKSTEPKAGYFETDSHYVAEAGLEFGIFQELNGMGHRSDCPRVQVLFGE